MRVKAFACFFTCLTSVLTWIILQHHLTVPLPVWEVHCERIREEAISLDAIGLFFECLPDDPLLCKDQQTLEQNRRRLAFYERFGARPLANTLYETPVKPEDDCPPYLVFDGLGRRETVPAAEARAIVRAILERKYGDYSGAEYNKMVINSTSGDPIVIRPPRYLSGKVTPGGPGRLAGEKEMAGGQ
ncbi:MAG: hypothetical protein R2756_09620 [Bacteroidales bacterium]